MFDVSVQVLGTELSTQTAFDGSYDFGTLTSGTFNVKFTKEGYTNKVVEDVEFTSGQVFELNVEMSTVISGIDISDQLDKLNVYPNPFRNEMTMEYALTESMNSGQLIADIYNTVGNRVQQFKLSDVSGKIDFGSGLPAGIYILKISNEDVVIHTQRLIKL